LNNSIEINLTDRNLKCEKVIAHCINKGETMPSDIIEGDWSIEELVRARDFLTTVIEENIKERLSDIQRRAYHSLKDKMEIMEVEKEEDLFQILSKKELELHSIIFSDRFTEIASFDFEIPVDILENADQETLFDYMLDNMGNSQLGSKDKLKHKDNVIPFPINKSKN